MVQVKDALRSETKIRVVGSHYPEIIKHDECKIIIKTGYKSGKLLTTKAVLGQSTMVGIGGVL